MDVQEEEIASARLPTGAGGPRNDGNEDPFMPVGNDF